MSHSSIEEWFVVIALAFQVNFVPREPLDPAALTDLIEHHERWAPTDLYDELHFLTPAQLDRVAEDPTTYASLLSRACLDRPADARLPDRRTCGDVGRFSDGGPPKSVDSPSSDSVPTDADVDEQRQPREGRPRAEDENRPEFTELSDGGPSKPENSRRSAAVPSSSDRQAYRVTTLRGTE